MARVPDARAAARREKAAGLIREGKSYEQVAGLTGYSVSSLRAITRQFGLTPAPPERAPGPLSVMMAQASALVRAWEAASPEARAVFLKAVGGPGEGGVTAAG